MEMVIDETPEKLQFMKLTVDIDLLDHDDSK